MTVAVITTLVVLGMAAIAVTVYAILSAEDGVEDEEGYHSLKSNREPDSRLMTRDEPPHAEMTASAEHSALDPPGVGNPDRVDVPIVFGHQTATAAGGGNVAGEWPTSSAAAVTGGCSSGSSGETAVLSADYYLTSSRFWFESFQNRQSEFLAIGSIVVLSICLCEKTSLEPKGEHAPHWKSEA